MASEHLEHQRKIMGIVDEYLGALDARDFHDPINWGDLSCTEVDWYTGTAQSGYRVWISEASPDCRELPGVIASYLALHGYPGVDVRTEW